MKIDRRITARKLLPKVERMFELSAGKILAIEKGWAAAKGTPVFTIAGRYTSRGWTEWTQGFRYGSALLQFDATGEQRFLKLGRTNTVRRMASHVTHFGVHDHGFNNISTYGNLWRLMREGRIPFNAPENDFYELALKASGAVQAARWTELGPVPHVANERGSRVQAASRHGTGLDLEHAGYIYSFNGPHSLFVDTLRSLRSLAVSHQLGHVLMTERDRKVSLLERLVQHALTTARFNIYYGEERDRYDVPGRTAHESLFDTNDGSYRCPSSQQGYSPFSTWTRGLAWAVLGFAEQLEFLTATPAKHSVARSVLETFARAAMVTAEFYIANTCADGIPMWDTGAPNLVRMGDYLKQPADPFNRWEPVDSSAAAIAAQGLMRLGNYLTAQGKATEGNRLRQAGLTVSNALLSEPYLAIDTEHEGLLLHSVYHWPNGWDYVAPGQRIPNGESSMWGDYHLRELGLLLLREAKQQRYPTFFVS